jgi:1-acyl-sn-glycerol-3-phosphate acyltransferase
MAYRYNLPVIPMVLSYRPRTGIYKWFDKPEIPLVTLHVGEPLFPDLTRNVKEESHRLLLEAHAQMVRMAGIKHNPWPACGD